jgi:phage gp29-like protein
MIDKVLQFLNRNYERISGKPVMTEIASISKSTEALNYFVGNILNNPDRVLSSVHAGTFNQEVGLNLYQEMVDKDIRIASGFRSRKMNALNKPWEIIPASEKNRDVQIAEFVKEALSFQRSRESRYELLDCIPKGLSIGEIMWMLKDDKILVADIFGRNPNRFIFDKDFNLRLRTPSAPYIGEELPSNKFIYLRNEPFAENPYGNAGCKELYWYYWFKKNAIKF